MSTENLLEIVRWCSLCNSAKSDGLLTIVPIGETEPVVIEACEYCVASIPKEDWNE